MIPFALLALDAPVADLPFERVNNRIYLRATLNGRPVGAVLDTGAGATVADATLGFAAGAKRIQAVSAAGAGEKRVAASLVSGLALRLVGTDVSQPVPIVLPLTPLDRFEGRPLSAILGQEFLSRFRVEIDYAARRVRLFKPDDAAAPAGATALKVVRPGGLPQTQGRIDLPGLGLQDVTMMLDTGATSAFTLTNRMVRRLGLDERFKDAPEITTGGGVGGMNKGRRIRLVAASVGGARLAAPIATLQGTAGGATGAEAAYDVLVGGEALRRFTVTLDYAHSRIFLVPNADRDAPFPGDRTGLFLALDAQGRIAVEETVPASPASEAGLARGDAILAIDGVAPKSLDAARTTLRNATGEVRVRIRRGASAREVVLATRELIP